MYDQLVNQKIKHEGKGVKKMKKIYLFFLISLFVVGLYGLAFAATDNGQVTLDKHTTVIEDIQYLDGEAISSTSTMTLVKTIQGTGDSKGTKTITQKSTTISKFMGSGLKAVSTSGTVDMTSTDGSSSNGTLWTTYNHDANGVLTSASGGGHTDSYDKEKGETTSSDTTDTYTIMRGEALRTSSTTSGTITRDGQGQAGNFSETTNYTYADSTSGFHVASEVTHTITNMNNGSGSDITRTITYSRDGNGVCTGMTATGGGTSWQRGESGGMEHYKITSSFTIGWDAVRGFEITNEHRETVQTDPATCSATC
jgi:hypothetical protein